MVLCGVGALVLAEPGPTSINRAGTGCADAVLVLAHGGSAEWNVLVEQSVAAIRSDTPVAVGFLMDRHGASVQEAYDSLVSDGAARIVAVPLMVSSHSGHIREIEYLVGIRDEAPGVHSGPGDGGGPDGHSVQGHGGGHEEMTPIHGPALIVGLGGGLDDHTLLADVLLDRAKALAENPDRETVVLVGHGPNGEDDATRWLENLDTVAERVCAQGGFRRVEARLLRDDAPEGIRDEALAKLRSSVEQAAADGGAIVVPVLVSKSRVVQQIPEILQGLDFAWSGDPLLPDERIGRILLARAREACTTDVAKDSLFSDEIIITGSRVEVNPEDLPMTVEVVTREELERLQSTSVGDALRYVPGVTVADNGMAGQQRVVVRGIGGRRTLLLVDGERVTSQRDMSGPPVLNEIDGVERIEVLKGPGSVMYGSDALAGVVNIITRDGRDADAAIGGQVGYRYSSASSLKQPNVAVQGALDRFDYRLSWSSTDSDDRETPQGTLDGTSYDSEQLAATFGMGVGLAGRLELRAEKYESTDIGVYTGSPNLVFNLPHWDRDRISFGFKGEGFGADELSAKVYRQSIDKAFVNSITFPVGPVNFMNILNSFDATSEIVGLDAFGQWLFSNAVLVAGVDARQEDAVGPSTSTTTMITPGGEIPMGTTEYVPVDAEQTAAGAFGELTMPWSRGELKLGLRYERVETNNRAEGETREPGKLTDDAVTGAIGLRYELGVRTNLVASLASGFRSPNLQERYYESPTHAGGGLTYGDPNLKAERSLQFEVGVRGGVGRSSYRLTAFSNDIDNLISTTRVPNPDIPGAFDYRYTNTADARITGFEGRLDTHLRDDLSALLSLTYTYGEDREEGDPIYVPPLNVMASLRWDQLFEQPLWAQLDLRWMDDQDRAPYQYDSNGDRDHEAEAELTSDSYVTVDLAVGFDFALGKTLDAQITVRGANLFDEDYEEPFTSVPQAGRHVVASVQLLF